MPLSWLDPSLAAVCVLDEHCVWAWWWPDGERRHQGRYSLLRLILGFLDLMTPTGTISRRAVCLLLLSLCIAHLSSRARLYSTRSVSFFTCYFSFFSHPEIYARPALHFVGWLGSPSVYGWHSQATWLYMCSVFIWT
jgi:hypothetical protein